MSKSGRYKYYENLSQKLFAVHINMLFMQEITIRYHSNIKRILS